MNEEYVQLPSGKLLRVIPRCADCGSLYCPKGGGLESLLAGCPGRPVHRTRWRYRA